MTIIPPVAEQKHEGTKLDSGKPRMDLLPYDALVDLAEIYRVGAEKYGENNWRKGFKWSRIFAAVQRHLAAFWEGQDIDGDSGLPHLSHAAFGILTLINFQTTHPDKDDRYKGKI